MKTWKVVVISASCTVAALLIGFLCGYQQGALQTSAYDVNIGVAIASLLRNHNDSKALEIAEVLIGIRSGTYTYFGSNLSGFKNAAFEVSTNLTKPIRQKSLKLAAQYLHSHLDAKIDPDVATFLEQQLPHPKS